MTLPHLSGGTFVTDGGMETTLIYQRGLELPCFASFPLLEDDRGVEALRSYSPRTGDAIEAVDDATDGAPAYFMINCAHPSHFAGVLADGVSWLDRIGGVRANASTRSHAELDAAEALDEGDPAELAARYRELRDLLPRTNVVGGCCGTDHRHIAAIADAWLEATG